MQRRAKYLLIAVAAAAVAMVALERPLPAPADPPPPAPAFVQERSHFPAALPDRAGMSTPLGDVFAERSWAPSVVPPQPAVQVSTPPAPPPMPYKFVGHLTRDGVVEHFLMKGDAVLPVKEGETLDGAYRVEAIAADEITLLYVPLGILSRLSLASALDHGGPGVQASAGAVNSAPPALVPAASPAPLQSKPPSAGSAPGPIAAQAPELPRTAATGTRAAHLRRERAQQLPPILR